MEADGDQYQRRRGSVAVTGVVLLGCALLACVMLAGQETVLERVLPGTAASAIKLVRSTASSTLLGGPHMTPIEEWARFDHGALYVYAWDDRIDHFRSAYSTPGYDEDTAETLRVIDEWQNPPNCEHRKYILWENRNSGLGELIA